MPRKLSDRILESLPTGRNIDDGYVSPGELVAGVFPGEVPKDLSGYKIVLKSLINQGVVESRVCGHGQQEWYRRTEAYAEAVA